MKRYSAHWVRRITLAAAIVTTAGLAGCATAASPEQIRTLVAQLQSDDVKVRQAACERAPELGPSAIGAVAKLLASENRSVAKSAKMALERIVYRASRPGAGADRARATSELIRLTKPDWPPVVRTKAVDLLGMLGGDRPVGPLAELLRDAQLRERARRALQRINTRRSNKALYKALVKADDPCFAAALIDSLGHNRYKPAVPRLLEAARSDKSCRCMRLSAIEALARIGDERAEPVLAEMVARGPAELRPRAFDAYMVLADELARRKKIAAARRIYEDGLAKATSEHARSLALIGLGRVGNAASVGKVLVCLGEPDPKLRASAIACLVELADPQAGKIMRAELAKAEPLVKAGLLRALAVREGPKATALLKAAAKDPSAEVRVTACELLGELDDPALAPTLLEAAEKGSDLIKPVALRSYLRLADGRLEAGQKAEALKMYHNALRLAIKAETRRQALQGIASIASPKSLPLVEPLLKDEAVRNDATAAYIAIAGTIGRSGQKDRAVAMLEKVIDRLPPRELAEQAGQTLRKLGVEIDLAERTGFVTHWWVIGPFPNEKKSAWDKAFFPEKEIKLDKAYTFQGKPMRWRKHHTEDVQGLVDLTKLMDPHDNVAAYAYAEITVPEAQDVLLKMGSDDDIVCWLNGKRIHANRIDRGVMVDDDVVQAKLQAGTNRILLKILQGHGGWGYCLRITDRQNRPVRFEQRVK